MVLALAGALRNSNYTNMSQPAPGPPDHEQRRLLLGQASAWNRKGSLRTRLGGSLARESWEAPRRRKLGWPASRPAADDRFEFFNFEFRLRRVRSALVRMATDCRPARPFNSLPAPKPKPEPERMSSPATARHLGPANS